MTTKQIATLFDKSGTLHISRQGVLKIAVHSHDYKELRDIRDKHNGFVERLLLARDGHKSVYNWNSHNNQAFLTEILPFVIKKKACVGAALWYLLQRKDMRAMKKRDRAIHMKWRESMRKKLLTFPQEFCSFNLILILFFSYSYLKLMY